MAEDNNDWVLDALKVDMDEVLAFIPADKKNWARQLLETTYADLVTTNHPVVITEGRDGQDILRWKADPLITALHDAKLVDLNGVCVALFDKRMSMELYLEFKRKIGYSLCGYAEVLDARRDDLRG
jgi:hypothetical protein